MVDLPPRINEEGHDLPPQDYPPPPRQWGQTCDLKALKMNWHTPSAEEMAQAERTLRKFLSAHLQVLRRFASGEDEGMTKEKLKRHLTVVDLILVGAASVLPFWTSSNSTAKDVNLYENTAVPLKSNDQVVTKSCCEFDFD